MDKWEQFRKDLEEISHLSSAYSLLFWDQNTYLPPLGAEARGKQLGLLAKLIHERWTSSKLEKWIEELEPWANNLPYDSIEASVLRFVKRKMTIASRIPSSFMEKVNQHFSKTHQAWVEAKAENDFAKIKPYLEQSLEYSREFSSFFPEEEHIADPLIQYREYGEYGMTVSKLKKLFAELRRHLVPMVEHIKQSEQPEDSFLRQYYPNERQLAFIQQVLTQLGFDQKRARLDLSPHPYMISIAHNDLRITTRVDEHFLIQALFSAIHETGHLFYEAGLDPELEGTPLHTGTSPGVHESQSRLWEHLVGASREFWEYFYPQLQSVFSSQLGNVTLEQFYMAINKVTPSLIRTDADEVTYNLHVIIRFDLELDLLEGKLEVKDLPEAWCERYQSDLGVTPPNDRLGVLQDIHWYHDLIGGSFQGYTIGNVLSCQFFAKAKEAIPELDGQIRQGKFATLYKWLESNIYRHGSKFTPDELVKRVTGSPLTIQPYIDYLYSKYEEIYPELSAKN